ncbi:MAG: GldG family protein, partial [bacterium]|nr:GldG family protein [bacterium]
MGNNTNTNKTTHKSEAPSGIQKYYKFLLYLVVLVLINIVSITLFFRVDLTSNGLYSLSDASVEAVSTLNEPLTINVFFSKTLPSPYNNVELYLHDLLEEYEASANKHLSYRFYDVSAEEGDLSEEAEGNRKLAHSYGIYPVNVQKIEQDESKVQRAYMGMALVHGDVIEKLPALISTEGLEYKITNAIRKMNNKISALVNLPEKIKVDLVISSSFSQIAGVIKLKGLDGLKTNVRDIVSRLNDKTYNQLQFNHIDPTMGEGTPEKLAKFERFLLKWPNIPQDKAPGGVAVTAGNGLLAISISYGDKSVEKNLLSRKMALTDRGLEEQFVVADAKNIETFINDNIDNIISINEDVGYLSTKGTQPLSVDLPPQMRMMQQQMPESLKKFNTLISKEYTVNKVKLGEEEIPESIDTLIIAGAK